MKRFWTFFLCSFVVALSSIILCSCVESKDSTYTITFETNGGSNIFNQSCKPGDKVIIDTPYKKGFEFDGWYIDDKFENEFDYIMPSKNITLYAKWGIKQVEINIEGYTSNEYSKLLKGNYGDKVVLPTLTKNNAIFDGWYEEPSYINKIENDFVFSVDKTLFAKWRFNEDSTIHVSKDASKFGDGTESSPISLDRACYYASKGCKIVLKNDTYELTSRINIPLISSGENGKRILLEGNNSILSFDMSIADSNRGVQLSASYWNIKNLTIEKAGDNGLLIGGSNNLIENCVFRENADSGLQIARTNTLEQPTIDTWPSRNIILNCTSYNNKDKLGENADGFACKLTAGEGNIFDGCISYNNSDDGWDLYAKSDTGQIGTTILVNCIAFNNGVTTDGLETADGDGNGYKLGGSNIAGNVILENCLAFNNRAHGFTDNSNPGVITLKNCTSYNNGTTGVSSPKDNFNLARNKYTANNNFYGLLSYSTDNSYSKINGDDFRGSIGYSVMRVCLDNINGKASNYAIEDFIEGNFTNEMSIGDPISISDDDFISLNVPNKNSDIHNLLRNEDGSINIGGFLKIKNESCLSTFNKGNPVGANLSKVNKDEYNHFVYTDIPNDEDKVQVKLKEAQESLYLSCNYDGVYLDLSLVTAINGLKVNWTSSDNELVTVDDPDNVGFGVVNRDKVKLVADKEVTLTATIEYLDELKNKSTITKIFKIKVKKYIPGIGEISGLDDKNFKYFIENDDFIEPSLEISDRNSKESSILVLNKDYSLNFSYKTSNGLDISAEDMINTPGNYSGSVTISLLNYDEVITKNYSIKVYSKDASIDINDLKSDYIIDGKFKVSGTSSYKKGKIYIIALPVGAKQPTSEQIKAGVDYSDTQVLGKCNITLDDFDFEAYVPVENNVDECIFYYTTENSIGKLSSNSYTKLDSDNVPVKIKGMISISTKEEFNRMANTFDESPKAYALINDLDFKDYEWIPASDTYYFSGLFDGNGHTISNLNIKGINLSGIFTTLREGTVKNLIIKNSSSVMTSDAQTYGVGMICGFMRGGTIENVVLEDCYVDGNEGVGGLVGTINNGSNIINKCAIYNGGSFTYLIKGKKRYIGGIIGGILDDNDTLGLQIQGSKTTISDCVVYSNIGDLPDNEQPSAQYVGGIVGRYKNEFMGQSLVIKNVYYEGSLNAQKYCGGVFGGLDKEGTYADAINCIVRPTIVFSQTENKTFAGKNSSDPYINSTNTICIGTSGIDFEVTKNNSQVIVSLSKTCDKNWWYKNSFFDFENTWIYEVNFGPKLR